MEVKKNQIVELWNGNFGKVISTLNNKAELLLVSGKRTWESFDNIVNASDTITEKEAKFISAKKKLSAYTSKKSELSMFEELEKAHTLENRGEWEKAAEQWQYLADKEEEPEFKKLYEEHSKLCDQIASDKEGNCPPLENLTVEGSKLPNIYSQLSKLAPGRVDEDKWDKAKDKVKKQRDKSESDLSDQDWGLVTTIYKNMGGRFESKSVKQGSRNLLADEPYYKDEAGNVFYVSDYPSDPMLKSYGPFVIQLELKSGTSLPKSDGQDFIEKMRSLGFNDPIKKGLFFIKDDHNWSRLIDNDSDDTKLFKNESASKKEAAHPNDFQTKYPIGTILVPSEGDRKDFIHVLDVNTESNTYILEKRPVSEDVDKDDKTYGVRYELPFAKLDNDKDLKVFASKKASLEAGCPRDLIAISKKASKVTLSFSDNTKATYEENGNFVSTNSKTFSKEYQKEFGQMLKHNGYDKLSAIVAQKRLAKKISALSKIKVLRTAVGLDPTDPNYVNIYMLKEGVVDGSTKKYAVGVVRNKALRNTFLDTTGPFFSIKESTDKSEMESFFEDKIKERNAIEFKGIQFRNEVNDLYRKVVNPDFESSKEIYEKETNSDDSASYTEANKLAKKRLAKKLAGLEKTDKKEVFTIDLYNETIEEGSDGYMDVLGKTYYDSTEAIDAAYKLIEELEDDPDLYTVSVYGGEYEDDNGNIYGDPVSIFSMSNQHDKEASRINLSSKAKTSVSNSQVIEMFLSDSFPKDKKPEWGTPNLRITKKPNGWALVNYSTPILYRDNSGTVYFNTQKYSVSTSKIQSDIRKTIQSLGVSVTEVDESGITSAIDSVTSSKAKIANLLKKAARLGNYDFDTHGGENWKLEACEDGKKKIVRIKSND